MSSPATTMSDAGLRRAVFVVALANLGYFGVEFSVALAIGSVSLFADSVDFLEDASVNLLILLALGSIGLVGYGRCRAKTGRPCRSRSGRSGSWSAWDCSCWRLACSAC